MSKNIEIDLVIEAIHRCYGYDFRHYRRETLVRRLSAYCKKAGLATLVDMVPKIVHDREFFLELFYDLSITVTEMFREPAIFRVIDKFVLPRLRTYPFINIWMAGCATGEEVYSMAIFIKENNLHDRTQIYATDINERALETARKGIYHLKDMKRNTKNYNLAGGHASLSNYYRARYNGVIMDQALRDNITFSNHNLVTDGVFAEMHLVFCRNVLIYFNPELQNRVIKLFYESLCHHGYLCLANQESIRHSSFSNGFTRVTETNPLYFKKRLLT